MAVPISAQTEAIIDSILRSLGANTLRLAEAPPNATVTGTLRVALAGAETEVTVSNGHLWPKVGRCRIVGATPEIVTYVQVLPAGNITSNKPPSYNGIGNPPEARLRLTPGTTVANAALINVPVHTPVDNQVVPERNLTGGLLGTHDLLGLLRALEAELTSAALAVEGQDAGLAILVDGSTGGDATGTSADYTTEFNDAAANDIIWIPAVEVADDDFFVIGYDTQWGSVSMTHTALGTDGTMNWEYWNGTAWATLTVAASVAGADDLLAAGTVSWTIPTDWATTTSTAITAAGTGRDAVQRYFVRMRVASLYTVQPQGDQGRVLMGAEGIAHTTGFIANTHAGDTITMVTGTAAGETATVLRNTANVMQTTAATAFSVIIDATDTFTVTPHVFGELETELNAQSPANYTSALARGTADTSNTVNEISTTMVNALIRVINQYGGAVPANDAASAQLAREQDRHTRLAVAAAAADTVITVEDASLLEGYTTITIGATTRTIATINAGRGGQGPQTVTLTAAIGGGGEPVGAVVTPSPRGTVDQGRLHLAPTPHAFGRGFQLYLDAAIAAVEAWTVPA